jgi:ribosomal protein L39E
MAEEKIKKAKLEKNVKEVKVKTEKPAKEKKHLFKKKEKKVPAQNIPVEIKKVKITSKQRAYAEKKAKLAVAGRQTKWAPVWAVMKKYGTGKRVHPSAMTAYKRNWRRTKLHIKPRRIRKWHMG